MGFDYTTLSYYALYLALDTGGTSRSEIARVQPGLLSYTIPDNTDQSGATCLVMYGINSHGEAATPSFGHCFEASDGTFTTTTVTTATTTTTLTSTVTVDPSQAAITSVAFTDTSTAYGYWIDGTVTWVAPNNPAFEYFRIVMSATSTGADGAIMVDNVDKSLRTYEIVNSDARGIVRGTSTGGIWANYIVVLAYSNLSLAHFVQAGSLMLTDLSDAVVGSATLSAR
ncbi:unnamed protein product [Symbiodinium natans]|uniref:Uncharacterized protein n=1 Tax=Symbiodinium natans TaxID=878477 RepID=A0A812JBC4_9DINO|nr:unnamed protein product [Symbiodinium natans]